MNTPTPPGRASILLQSASSAALTAAVLLGVAWATAATAMAASCSREDCDNVARALHSTQVPLTKLTIRIVDLGDAESTDAPPSAADLAASPAPLLFLTPRVTSILEDVFGDSRSAAPAEKVTEPEVVADEDTAATSARERENLPTSPVADTDGRIAAQDERYSAPVPALDNPAGLPRFQRQMYRTDI